MAGKSNDIIAIPKLLRMLAIEGAIVTIDTTGGQRDIAQATLDKKADYVLALRGNQASLREYVEVFVAEQKARGFADTDATQDMTIDAGHDRIETLATTVTQDVGWLRERHDLLGLNAINVNENGREINGETVSGAPAHAHCCHQKELRELHGHGTNPGSKNSIRESVSEYYLQSVDTNTILRL